MWPLHVEAGTSLGRVPEKAARRMRVSRVFSSTRPASNRPEVQLLLACARTVAGAETVERVKGLLREDMDWGYVLQKARQNRIMPLLYWNLNAWCPEAVPKHILNQLRAFFHGHARHNLSQTRELVRLLRLFDSHGISALPFKGPILAALVYGNVSLRHFGDLDILVHRRHLRRVKRLLFSRGYSFAVTPSWLEQSFPILSRRKDFIFTSQDQQTRIELHWRLSGNHFRIPFKMKRLWDQLEPIAFAGSKVRSLPLEDLILYLCLHGTRHSWERLAWICDVAELIRVHPEIDWDNLMKRARMLGNERALALGLFLASDLLGAGLPADVSARIQIDPKVRLAATRVHQLLFRQEANGLDISYWYHHHLLMRERFRDRVRLYLYYCRRFFRLTVTPNARDHALLPLPGSLSFLYYMLRPFRLVGKYGGSTCQRLFERLLRQKQSSA
jgi:hypothetical protein